MAAYLIVNLDVHDVDTFNEYRTRVPDFIAKHGGEYLVRAGEFEVLEGDWIGDRYVVFRFPDRAAIRNLFDDPDYQELAAVRKRSARSNIVAVDGIG